MDNQIFKRFRIYQLTLIFSLVFTLLGFSYNVWRMEASETNNNIRTACFEVLIELAELEQLVYAAHYDKNSLEGNPRKGWVKIGLINDLSSLTNHKVAKQSAALKQSWMANWQKMTSNNTSAQAIVASADNVRSEIKMLLQELQ